MELFERYKVLVKEVESRGGVYLPLIADPVLVEDIFTEVMNFNSWFLNWAKNIPKVIERVPVEGHWYMVTVTQPAVQSKEEMLAKHELCMAYFERNGIDVYLAGLEKSSIWHVHYALCSSSYFKNVKRDLCKLLGVKSIDVGKRVKHLREFQGMCNYVLKRGYDDDKTHVDNLVKKLDYVEGSGWKVI